MAKSEGCKGRDAKSQTAERKQLPEKAQFTLGGKAAGEKPEESWYDQ